MGQGGAGGAVRVARGGAVARGGGRGRGGDGGRGGVRGGGDGGGGRADHPAREGRGGGGGAWNVPGLTSCGTCRTGRVGAGHSESDTVFPRTLVHCVPWYPRAQAEAGRTCTVRAD